MNFQQLRRMIHTRTNYFIYYGTIYVTMEKGKKLIL